MLHRLFQRAHRTPTKAEKDRIMAQYAAGTFGVGKAAELLDISQDEVEKLLEEYNLDWQLTVEEFQHDVQALLQDPDSALSQSQRP